MDWSRRAFAPVALGALVASAGSALASPAVGLTSSPLLAGALGFVVFGLGMLAGHRVATARSEEARHRLLRAELDTARHELAACREDTEALHRSIAHDLRSPIGAVLNFATVLELDHGDDLGPEGRSVLNRIRRSAESGLSLLDALSRLSGVSRAPFRLTPVEVEAIARQAFAEVGAGAPRADLSIGALPPVLADADLLHVAFREVLSNAVKFTSGRTKPKVAVGGRREADGSVTYWVADDGVGFDMRFGGKLFRPFERLHSRDEFPGAGVGLAIVRKVAERHGGRAWAEGAVDGGARVYISLPNRATGA